MSEKTLGADAAADVSAGSIALDAASHAAHTPGQWTLRECSHGGMLLRRGDQSGPDRHEQSSLQILPTADAHLIAAAPELLEALKECSFRLATMIAAHKDFSDANARCLDAATAAIAKAEGRS